MGAGFLSSPCSCQAKAANPGVDLLISTDWDALLADEPVVAVELPPLIGVTEIADPVSERPDQAEALPAAVEAEAAQVRVSTLKRNLLVAGLGGILVVAAAGVIMLITTKRSHLS